MLLAAIVFATQLTLEQKVGQLIQIVPDQLPNALAGSMLNAGEHVAEAQRNRKIPLLIAYDVIHGYRTIFPIPLAIASSWDPSLAELSARIAAHEASAAGVQWTFAPMVDIARDPRWGRIAEGAGEDPLLGSRMAAAYVRGFQSEPGFLACAKHYAAYGGAEGGRDYNTVDMSERTLREIYLPPFRAAVDAGVWTLMSAFDSLSGVPASANRHLLTDILRNEWGFKGFVVSDWDAVDQLINHGLAGSKEEAAIKAITAGVDMDMHDEDYATLVDAVRGGRVPVSVIDTAVRRVTRAKLYTTMLHVSAPPPLDRGAARRIAQRSIILLKNDGALLPLSRNKKIAVVGPLATSNEDMLGPWAAQGKGADAISVADAIPSVPIDEADVIVAVLGETREMSGEAASRSSLDLPDAQERYLESLVARGKPVVLVLMSGRPLSIEWAAQNVPAIVEAWFPGIE
ncbi:MAG TPA: glycoside hydrolase family 3 N-terminal domain-containing protein, partial [Thermoanaerobaculia bacterium]|nr:glycoside hydrolase family 3 N-terminal domain-containing protein [Thermoanaerobaculia bacterium]